MMGRYGIYIGEGYGFDVGVCNQAKFFSQSEVSLLAITPSWEGTDSSSS